MFTFFLPTPGSVPGMLIYKTLWSSASAEKISGRGATEKQAKNSTITWSFLYFITTMYEIQGGHAHDFA